MLKLEPSPLQLPTLHSAASPILHEDVNFRKIFKCAFKLYGIWPQASMYVTNTLPLLSPASVGLAQARPNKCTMLCSTALLAWLLKIHQKRTYMKCGSVGVCPGRDMSAC